jgi:hypothetical protein
MTLAAAASSVALWKNLQRGAETATPLRDRGADLLNAAMDAAWANAVVRCYALQDKHRNTVSLDRVLKLSAEIDPRTGRQFIASKDRLEIQARLDVATRQSQNIALLRHNEVAHISAVLSLPEINRIKAKARGEIDFYMERCLEIFADITLAGYGRALPLPDFDKEIGEDLEVLLTAYSNLQGTSTANLES